MSFLRTGIQIGPVMIHFYGIAILCGILAGTKLASVCGRRHGYTEDDYWDMMTYAVIAGIIGARLWHVLFPSASSGITLGWYLSHPAEIFAVWKGGLGIPGGIAGGALGIALFCRRHHLDYPSFMDTIGVGLPLGQAIGRWGNYFNQELYGKPSTLPWAITIEPAYREAVYADVATYHPLFLYESLYNLVLCFLLYRLDRAGKAKKGNIFLLYLAGYGFGRFFLEFLRLDTAQVGGLNVNQFVMAGTSLIAGTMLLIRGREAASGSKNDSNYRKK